ncbi:MAG: bifunctional riboflavin kinase/FAD synthetase [Acidimicrobiales bacterium]|nr:bifunctional riboflavin kinase/FAD synthetase [Acidimicrobiales bacterium]
MSITFLPEAPDMTASAVTIGVFDGVHRGHQELILNLAQRAKELSLPSVVLTFDQHPANVLSPDLAPKMITSLDDKISLIESLGVDHVVVIPFSKEWSYQSAEDFVSEVLVDKLKVKLLMVGQDFRFGRDRKGDVSTLISMGGEFGFLTIGYDLVKKVTGSENFDEIISSTLIRKLITVGDIEQVSIMLGRLPFFSGEVVKGDSRGGRELGFPTANLVFDPTIVIPGNGVYATFVDLGDGKLIPSATSVGTRPTFLEGAEVSFETFIIDFDGNLYGKKIQVHLVKKIRDDLKFDNRESLIARMHQDVADTLDILSTIKM